MKVIQSLIVAGSLFSSVAFACGTAVGPILAVSRAPNNHMVFLLTAQNTFVSCAPRGGFAVDLNTEAGQATWKTVLAATSQSKSISIAGTGECPAGIQAEQVASVLLMQK